MNNQYSGIHKEVLALLARAHFFKQPILASALYVKKDNGTIYYRADEGSYVLEDARMNIEIPMPDYALTGVAQTREDAIKDVAFQLSKFFSMLTAETTRCIKNNIDKQACIENIAKKINEYDFEKSERLSAIRKLSLAVGHTVNVNIGGKQSQYKVLSINYDFTLCLTSGEGTAIQVNHNDYDPRLLLAKSAKAGRNSAIGGDDLFTDSNNQESSHNDSSNERLIKQVDDFRKSFVEPKKEEKYYGAVLAEYEATLQAAASIVGALFQGEDEKWKELNSLFKDFQNKITEIVNAETVEVDSLEENFEARKKRYLSIAKDIDEVLKTELFIPDGYKYAFDLKNESHNAAWIHNMSAHMRLKDRSDLTTGDKQYFVEFRIFLDREKPSGFIIANYGSQYAGEQRSELLERSELWPKANSFKELAYVMAKSVNAGIEKHQKLIAEQGEFISNISDVSADGEDNRFDKKTFEILVNKHGWRRFNSEELRKNFGEKYYACAFESHTGNNEYLEIYNDNHEYEAGVEPKKFNFNPELIADALEAEFKAMTSPLESQDDVEQKNLGVRDRIMIGEALVMSDKELESWIADGLPDDIVSVQNPDQVGILDAYLVGKLSNPKIQSLRLKKGLDLSDDNIDSEVKKSLLDLLPEYSLRTEYADDFRGFVKAKFFNMDIEQQTAVAQHLGLTKENNIKDFDEALDKYWEKDSEARAEKERKYKELIEDAKKNYNERFINSMMESVSEHLSSTKTESNVSPLDAFENAGGEPWHVTQNEWVEIMSGHFRFLNQEPETLEFKHYHEAAVVAALKSENIVSKAVIDEYQKNASRVIADQLLANGWSNKSGLTIALHLNGQILVKDGENTVLTHDFDYSKSIGDNVSDFGLILENLNKNSRSDLEDDTNPFGFSLDQINLPIEMLEERDVLYPVSSKVPSEIIELPLGSIRVQPFGELEERYVEVLRNVSVDSLLLAEPEDNIKNSETYQLYLEWAKSGLKIPYINVNENEKGQLISVNRRRTLVAKELEHDTITAWVSPINKETGDPLKFGDLIDYVANKELNSSDKESENVDIVEIKRLIDVVENQFIDKTSKELALKYLNEIILSINDLNKNKIKYPHIMSYLDDIETGNREGVAAKKVSSELVDARDVYAKVKTNKIKFNKIIGANGNKELALKYLDVKISECEIPLKESMLLVRANLGNYRHCLRDILRTGLDSNYKSNEQLTKEAEQKSLAEKERNERIAEMQKKSIDLGSYEKGGDKDLKRAFTRGFVVQNEMYEVLNNIADYKTPNEAYEYLIKRAGENHSGVKVNNIAFKNEVDLNRAKRNNIEWTHLKVMRRKGYTQVEITIDLDGPQKDLAQVESVNPEIGAAQIVVDDKPDMQVINNIAENQALAAVSTIAIDDIQKVKDMKAIARLTNKEKSLVRYLDPRKGIIELDLRKFRQNVFAIEDDIGINQWVNITKVSDLKSLENYFIGRERMTDSQVNNTNEISGNDAHDISTADESISISGMDRDEIAKKYFEMFDPSQRGVGPREFHYAAADAILEKDAYAIEHIANGLNDKLKALFTDVTGIKLPRTQGETWNEVLKWAGISKEFDLHRKAQNNLNREIKQLESLFGAQAKIVTDEFDKYISEGFVNLKKSGRNNVLENPTTKQIINFSRRGSNLNKTLGYVSAKIEVMSAEKKLNVENGLIKNSIDVQPNKVDDQKEVHASEIIINLLVSEHGWLPSSFGGVVYKEIKGMKLGGELNPEGLAQIFAKFDERGRYLILDYGFDEILDVDTRDLDEKMCAALFNEKVESLVLWVKQNKGAGTAEMKKMARAESPAPITAIENAKITAYLLQAGANAVSKEIADILIKRYGWEEDSNNANNGDVTLGAFTGGIPASTYIGLWKIRGIEQVFKKELPYNQEIDIDELAKEIASAANDAKKSADETQISPSLIWEIQIITDEGVRHVVDSTVNAQEVCELIAGSKTSDGIIVRNQYGEFVQLTLDADGFYDLKLCKLTSDERIALQEKTKIPYMQYDKAGVYDDTTGDEYPNRYTGMVNYMTPEGNKFMYLGRSFGERTFNVLNATSFVDAIAECELKRLGPDYGVEEKFLFFDEYPESTIDPQHRELFDCLKGKSYFQVFASDKSGIKLRLATASGDPQEEFKETIHLVKDGDTLAWVSAAGKSAEENLKSIVEHPAWERALVDYYGISDTQIDAISFESRDAIKFATNKNVFKDNVIVATGDENYMLIDKNGVSHQVPQEQVKRLTEVLNAMNESASIAWHDCGEGSLIALNQLKRSSCASAPSNS